MIKFKLETKICLLFFFMLSIMALVFNGTGDDGDSIMHFMYAKYAFKHPVNFFNHWAKPMYVMLFAPIAQFGFTAIKVTNAAILSICMFYTIQVAKKLNYSPNYLVTLFFIGSPFVYSCTLSGLTEPLFACLLIYSIYQSFENRHSLASICFSLLPFVRSEGLIILFVILFYYLISRNWKYIPLLATGHLAYGLMGWPVQKTPFWVITKIPYAGGKNVNYGAGTWDYYILHLSEILGHPITILLCIGLALSSLRLLGSVWQRINFSVKEMVLIYGTFLAFSIAHSIFWFFGIFNSFGLTRVFLGVLPLMALIGTYPLHLWYKEAESQKLKDLYWIPVIALFSIGLIYKQAWSYRLNLNEDQLAYKELTKKYGEQLKSYCIYTDAVYPLVELKLDYFDPIQTRRTPSLYQGDNLPPKSAVIWDFRYSVIEGHMSLEKLQSDPRFKIQDVFTAEGKPAIYLFLTDSLLREDSAYLQSYDWDNIEFDGRDSTISKSGKYSFCLTKKLEFSPGINFSISELNSDKIRVQFNYYYAKAESNKPQLVWSFEDEHGKILNWNSRNFISEDSKEGQWNNFIYDINFDRNKLAAARIKIYVWNSTNMTVYLDDLNFTQR